MVDEKERMDQRLDVCIRTARDIGNEATRGFTHNRLDKFSVDWVENQMALLEEWTKEVPPVGAMVTSTIEKFGQMAREPENRQEIVFNRTWAWLWGAMDAIEYALVYLREVDQ